MESATTSCGTHLPLLAPGAMWLLSKWMPHWWWVSSSTVGELLP